MRSRKQRRMIKRDNLIKNTQPICMDHTKCGKCYPYYTTHSDIIEQALYKDLIKFKNKVWSVVVTNIPFDIERNSEWDGTCGLRVLKFENDILTVCDFNNNIFEYPYECALAYESLNDESENKEKN